MRFVVAVALCFLGAIYASRVTPKTLLAANRESEGSDFFGSAPLGKKNVFTYVGPASAKPGKGWVKEIVEISPDTTWGPKGVEFSQSGQDWIAASLLGCRSNGYFLDLAANNASRLSNTLMLEQDFDWNGICVEPNPIYLPGLKKRRCTTVVAVAGSPTDAEVEFQFDGSPERHKDKGISGVYGGIVADEYDNKAAKNAPGSRRFHTVALPKMLQDLGAPSVIDYFSLDIEGAESLVMKDFPWDHYKFLVLTVERPKPDLEKLLSQHGYHYLMKNCNYDDQTWVHESLPDFDKVTSMYKDGVPLPDTCMDQRGRHRPETLGHGLKNNM